MAQQMPLLLTISCSSKSRLVLPSWFLPFWYLLTRVVPDKFQKSSKTVVCVCVCEHTNMKEFIRINLCAFVGTVRTNAHELVCANVRIILPRQTRKYTCVFLSNFLIKLTNKQLVIDHACTRAHTHGILPVQFTCLTVFFHSLSKFSLVYLLAWHPPLHSPYISSPNHCLLFAAHAHAPYHHNLFCCIPRLCLLILVYLSALYLELYQKLFPS